METKLADPAAPLNLSTKDGSPRAWSPAVLPALKFELGVKEEPERSPSPVSPAWSGLQSGSSPPRSPAWPPHRPAIWSPALAEPDTAAARSIWSPAVSCEQESRAVSTNNNTVVRGAGLPGKVVVEVRCGGCGEVTSQFRPDTLARCGNCPRPAARPERLFKVSTTYQSSFSFILVSNYMLKVYNLQRFAIIIPKFRILLPACREARACSLTPN